MTYAATFVKKAATMKHENCTNPAPKQPWQVDDNIALECIPKEGWIREMVDYMIECTDAPVWFHLGAVLTTLSTAAGQAELLITRQDDTTSRLGFQLWSVIIGQSGTRKSQSSNIAVRILNNASMTNNNPSLILPADGSVEGLHDALAEEKRSGVGLYYPGELRQLFDMYKRNYSKSMITWFLRTYERMPMDRALVKKKGEGTEKSASTDIARLILTPSLSILGTTPPTTLQNNTDKESWSSGFLPRFLFWGARRTKYMELSGQILEREAILCEWLKRIIVRQKPTIIIPYELAQPILKWIRKNVEDKGVAAQPEIFSTLNRLQDKAFQIAGLMCIARHQSICKGTIVVDEEDIKYAIRVLEAMYGTFWALFTEVSGTPEGTQEKSLLRFLDDQPDCSRKEIGEALGDITPTTLYRMLRQLVQEGVIIEVKKARAGRGRRESLYSLSKEPF